MVTLEQTGLLTQEAAENALQSLRKSLEPLQEHEEIHKLMIKNESDRSDPLVRIDGRDDITENKIEGGTISNLWIGGQIFFERKKNTIKVIKVEEVMQN